MPGDDRLLKPAQSLGNGGQGLAAGLCSDVAPAKRRLA